MRSIVQRCLVVAATVVALVGFVPTPALARPYTASSNPILFVHGWNSNASTWDAMLGRFRADGWPASHLRAFSYDTTRSNAVTADVVNVEVDRLRAATGAAEVDVISHSMGGLSSRYYTKNLRGDLEVDRWVSLGGPNHGTGAAVFCGQASCVEMRRNSQFLNALNAGDETPGAAEYATWWSSCDNVISPPESTILAGAANTRTACVSHSGLKDDATIYVQVRDFVNP